MFLPKRGVIAGVLTAGALVLLLSFRTPDVPVLSDVSDGAAITGTGPAATTGASGGIAGATALPATTLPNAASGAPTLATPAPSTLAPTATEAPAAAATPAVVADGTVAGDAVRIRWGYVQVQVTIADGAIMDVTTLQIPMGDPRSAQINSYAEPFLRESALQSQSAAIDYVSGATFTSQAYASSLQSALDRVSIQG